MPIVIERKTRLSRRPRLQEACDQLEQLADGLGANAKLPTLVELRKQLGFSMQTLHDAVRELEERHVLNSVHGVGIYVTEKWAPKPTGNIGFLAPYGMRPEENIAYWGTVLAGTRSAARDRGYHLLLIDDINEFDGWDKIDGAIFCNMHDPRDPHPGMPQPPRHFPGVAILNQDKRFASITTKDFDGVYQLTRHLIELGHQRIAYLATMSVDLSIQTQRKEGYLKALEESGIEVVPYWMREIRWRVEWDDLSTWYPAAGEYYMGEWLEDNWTKLGCTALVTQNDDVAQGAIKALHTTGLEVPCDVSVVGFDGLPVRGGEPELTTIHVPLFDVGEHAMRLLLDCLQNPTKKPQNVCLPVNLVVGKTTAAAPDLAH